MSITLASWVKTIAYVSIMSISGICIASCNSVGTTVSANDNVKAPTTDPYLASIRQYVEKNYGWSEKDFSVTKYDQYGEMGIYSVCHFINSGGCDLYIVYIDINTSKVESFLKAQ